MQNIKSAELFEPYDGEGLQGDAHLAEIIGVSEFPVKKPSIAISGLQRAVEFISHHRKEAVVGLGAFGVSVGFLTAAHRQNHREVQTIT